MAFRDNELSGFFSRLRNAWISVYSYDKNDSRLERVQSGLIIYIICIINVKYDYK